MFVFAVHHGLEIHRARLFCVVSRPTIIAPSVSHNYIEYKKDFLESGKILSGRCNWRLMLIP